jgi:hypothetical protein
MEGRDSGRITGKVKVGRRIGTDKRASIQDFISSLADLRVLILESRYGLVISRRRPYRARQSSSSLAGSEMTVYASLSSSVRYLGAMVLTF